MKRLILAILLGNLALSAWSAYPMLRDMQAEVTLAKSNPAYYRQSADALHLRVIWQSLWFATTLCILPTALAASVIAATHARRPREFLLRRGASWPRCILLVVVILSLSVVGTACLDVLFTRRFPRFLFDNKFVFEQWLLHPLVFTLITGIFMLFTKRMRPGRCSQCNYDIAHSINFGRCPECGTAIMTLK